MNLDTNYIWPQITATYKSAVSQTENTSNSRLQKQIGYK